MARSTKLERLITDPLKTRLTTVENKVTTVETRSLVDEGDNVSVLVNDAGYQNAAQVNTKIQAVVGAAPAALDTLKEIADKLATEDSAIAALVAADTANAVAVTALQAYLQGLNAAQVSVAYAPVGISLNQGESGVLTSNVENFLTLIDQELDNITNNLFTFTSTFSNNFQEL